MKHRLSPWTLARHNVRYRIRLATTVAIALAAASGLTALMPLLAAAGSEAQVQAALAHLPDRGVIVVSATPGGGAGNFEVFQSDAEDRVLAALGGHVRAGAAYATLTGVVPDSIDGRTIQADSAQQPLLEYLKDLAPHVRLLSGRLGSDSTQSPGVIEASLPAAAAAALGLHSGDDYCLRFKSSPRPPFCVKMVGVWQPVDASAAYWGGAPPSSALILSEADLYGLQYRDTPDVRAGHYFMIDGPTIHAGDSAALAEKIKQLRGHFQFELGGSFSTSLDAALRQLAERQRFAAGTFQLIAGTLLVVGLFAIGFTAARFLEGESGELASLRSRGWPRRLIIRVAAWELVLIALVAIPVGLVAAAATCSVLALSLLQLPAASFAAAAASVASAALPALLLTLLAAALLLAVLAWRASGRRSLELQRGASRPAGMPSWRRNHVDLLLLAPAAALLYEASVRSGAGIQDPLTALFPATVVGLAALAGLRLLVPLCAAAGAMRPNLPASLATTQLARRPAQHAAVAIVLTVGVALVTFSAVELGTDRRNSVDRADYAAGADLRATYKLQPDPVSVTSLATSLAGVTASSVAYRADGSPGYSAALLTILGVDPGTLPDVAWNRPGLLPGSLAGLLRPLVARDPDGLALQAGGSSLSVWAQGVGLEGELAAELEDSSGHTRTLPLGSVRPSAWVQLRGQVAVPPSSRLRALRLTRPSAGSGAGELLLSGLALDDRVVAPLDGGAGWVALQLAPSTQPTLLPPSSEHPREGRRTLTVPLGAATGELVLRPPPSEDPLPALVSRSLVSDLGLQVGQGLPIQIHGQTVPVVVAGVIDAFPSSYPSQDYTAVLPRETLLGRLAATGSELAWPNELWLRVAGDTTGLAARLRSAGPVNDLQDRRAGEAAALSDPVHGAFAAALVVGWVGLTLLVALCGGLHVLAMARERLGEYAVLQANGLRPKEIAQSFDVEQGVLLAHGLVVGVALGAVLTAALAPAVHLGGGLRDLVPPTVVTVEPALVLGALVALMAALLVASRLGRLAGLRFDLLRELRLVA